MPKENATEKLRLAIAELEAKRRVQANTLKEHLTVMAGNLKPVNIIKNTLHNLSETPEVKEGLVNIGIGIITGLLSKKILVGNTHNPIKIMLGNLLQFGVTSTISKHADGIRTIAGTILRKIFSKKEETEVKPYH